MTVKPPVLPSAPSRAAVTRAAAKGAPRHHVVVWTVLLIAFGLRLSGLGVHSLWEDEIFTATQTVLPVPELLAWTAGDIHPPGYYLVLRLAAFGGGWAAQTPGMETDWLWRLPSAFFGVLAVAACYRLGRRVMEGRTASIATLLLAVSPAAVQYSQEARMHEMFLLTALLSTWALAEALARPNRWIRWLLYGLASAASMYTVYLGFAVLAAQAAWVLVEALRKDCVKMITGWAVGCIVTLLCYLPWLPVLTGILMQKLAAPSGVGGALGSPGRFGLGFLYSLGPGEAWAPWLFLGLWLVGLLSLVRRSPGLAVLGAAWMLLPALAAYKLNDPRAMHMRNAYLLPVYLLLVATGISWAGDRLARITRRGRHSWAPLAFLAAAVTVASLVHLPTVYNLPKTDWRRVAAYLEERTRAGDVIVTGALFDMRRYLDYYYRGPAELVTPALLVQTLPHRVKAMRSSGGSVWAVTRFSPAPTAAMRVVPFTGLVVSEPVLPVYEPDVLAGAMIRLGQEEVAASLDWAAAMQRQGLMDPDPLVSRAAARLFMGDVYRAAGDMEAAIEAYRAMVADNPTSAGGFVVLAGAYDAAGRTEEAAHAYAQAVALDRRWQEIASHEALPLLERGEWAAAVDTFKKIFGPAVEAAH